MGKMESALRDEIARLARKEVKTATDPLNKQIQELKAQIRKVKRATAKGAPAQSKTKLDLTASKKEVEATRIGPRWIKALRKRHKLSQGGLADLLGISMSAVCSWEYGRARPAGRNREALVALRRMRHSEFRAAIGGK